MQHSSIRDRALELLGSNATTTETAAALGVDPSRISQLLAETEFYDQVIKKRFENARSHIHRDNKYDRLEDALLEKLDKSMAMLFDPLKIAAVLSRVNAAKRRAPLAANVDTANRQVVVLQLPPTAIQQFVLNGNNQVAVAGTQQLVTIQPKQLLEIAHEPANAEQKTLPAPVIESSTTPAAEANGAIVVEAKGNLQ